MASIRSPSGFMDKLHRVSLACGFVMAQLQFIPAIATTIHAISLLFYFAGYLFWLTSSEVYKDYAITNEHWYTFASIKTQYSLASWLGMFAVACCSLSFFYSSLLVPTYWIFVLCNFCWSSAEETILDNPPPKEIDHEFSTSYQKAYSRYSKLITALSVLTALSTTMTTFFPSVAVIIFSVSPFISIPLTFFIAHAFYIATFEEHKIDHDESHDDAESYVTISEYSPPEPFRYNRRSPNLEMEENELYELYEPQFPPLYRHPYSIPMRNIEQISEEPYEQFIPRGRY